MGTAEDYEHALAVAGFHDIRLVDRNAWYRDVARSEHAALTGPLYARLVAQLGEEFTRHEIEVWRALTVVLDSGELRPTHLRAPASLTETPESSPSQRPRACAGMAR
jgi:phosphoethanolamine N-methyltransferase